MAEPAQKKTKTKNQLAKAIFKKNLMPGSTESSIVTKIYRFEKEGYIKEPTDLIEAILKVLLVDKEDLLRTRNE